MPVRTGKENMSENMPKLTPMYRQYMEIKQEYPDALLFYRMGDFYELFFEDAELASRELQLTLTSRSKDDGGVPMCGVPWHAAEAYISQLVEKGFKIAVCDQIEDPKQAKGLVKRAVTRVVTSGTALCTGTPKRRLAASPGWMFPQVRGRACSLPVKKS